MEKEQIELYFIQFLFTKNRELLLKEARDLYDVLLEKYTEIYLDGRERNLDLMDIERKFLSIFGSSKRVTRKKRK